MSDSTNLFPVISTETQKLLVNYGSFDSDDLNAMLNSSIEIVKNFPHPIENNNFKKTGLVIGYVQSGKTASFTTVSALARDNNFGAVILITGISTLLLGQSTSRLIDDLGLKGVDSSWIYLNNPTQDRTYETVESALRDWANPKIPSTSKRALYITVLKNHAHLKNLIDLFSQLPEDLASVPTLIIDDEADQASLNTEARNNARRHQEHKESTTYRKIGQIRDLFKTQVYLQYTATPQGVLLINLLDRLSPDFHHVLSPGQGYSGGKFFFDSKNKGVYTEEIPLAEIPSSPGDRLDPPPTLIFAMRIFIIGIASEIMKRWSRGEKLNRNISMLVHPSHRTNMHLEYDKWVSAILQQWKLTFTSSKEDPDRKALCEEFFPAYENLFKTAQDFPEWAHLKDYLEEAVTRVNHLVLNAVDGDTPEVDWDASTYTILVGGQAVDRGFTVRGLTVTYLPRPSSSSNEDSLQQRARFFGYKKDLLGYCRLFLDDANYNNFKKYVSYEEQMRADLLKVGDIKNWERLFFDSHRPTRRNVISSEIISNLLSGWNIPDMPLMDAPILSNNQKSIENYLSALQFELAPANLNGLTNSTTHYVCRNVDSKIFVEFLKTLKFEDLDDSIQHIGLLTLIETVLEKKIDEFGIDLYWIAKNESRERSLNTEWCWTQKSNELSLFQGRSAGSEKYQGDREVKSSGNRISVQFHFLMMKTPDSPPVSNVPVLAVWVPKELQRSIMYLEDYSPTHIS